MQISNKINFDLTKGQNQHFLKSKNHRNHFRVFILKILKQTIHFNKKLHKLIIKSII